MRHERTGRHDSLTQSANGRRLSLLYGRKSVPTYDFPVPQAQISRSFFMSKRTFQPNNRRRAKVHGFRARMRTRAGRAIISARRGKGRAKLTA